MKFAQHSPAAHAARMPHCVHWHWIARINEEEPTMQKANPTPKMVTAFEHAQDALIMAIRTVDEVLRDHNRSWHNNPELVVGVMNVAGQIYTALTIQDAVSTFIAAQDERSREQRYH
jgi:chemotaxis signal transduction protein